MKILFAILLLVGIIYSADETFGDYDTSTITPQSDIGGYAFSQRYEEPFTCPGTGDSTTLKGLYTYAASSGGTAGNINIAIYKNGDTTRIAYGTTKKAVTLTNRSWVGFSQAELTPNPVKLKQGENYRLVVSVEGADVAVCYITTGSRLTLYWENNTWYNGFPTPLTLGSLSTYARLMKAVVNSDAVGGGCDSMLSIPDTVGTRSDGVSVYDSLICDSGKVVLRYWIDGGDSGRDSVVHKDSPYRYTDTIPMEPSDSVTYQFIFKSDTGTGVDTTIKRGAWSRDSTDSSGYYYFAGPIDSFTITINQPTHGTITTVPSALKRGAGDQSTITLSADAHYHVLASDPWSGDMTDSTTNPLTYVFGLSDQSISGNIVVDTHFIAHTDDAHSDVTYATDSLGEYSESVTVYAAADEGYRLSWPGGSGIQYDTLVIVVSKDTTIAVTSSPYEEPVDDSTPIIDSITNLTSRDVYPSVARIGDTMVLHGRNFLGDSSKARVWINSYGTFTVRPIYITDTSVNYIIPTGLVRGFYRTRFFDGEILSANPTSNNCYIKVYRRY